MLFVALAVMSLPLTAQAAGSPRVVVARDATSSSDCQLIITHEPNTPAQRTETAPCPAGTVIVTDFVPKSEAVAVHQAFVALPDPHADAAAMGAVRQQISRLMDSVRDTAAPHQVSVSRPNAATAQPLASIACNSSATVGARATITWDNSTKIDGSVNYYLDPSCSHVTLNSAYAARNTGYANVYWQYSAYASGHWGWSCDGNVFSTCPYIDYSTVTQGINSTHNAGYWFQEQYCSGSHCSPFDSWARYNFAILS